MNIVQALNKVKTDLLNFITINLQNKADTGHKHNAADINDGTFSSDVFPVIPLEKGGTNASNGTEGLSNLLAAGNTILSSYQFGDVLPTDNSTETIGRIFFKKVSS